MRIRAVVLAAAFAAIVHSSASAATPKIDARAYEVVNAATGEVLLADNARTQLPMASITKLMTVLVALERAKLDDVVEVDRDAVGVTGSGVRLRAGERLTVRDLVAAAIVQSANDAAIALAAHVSSGDEDAFVALMNRRARSARPALDPLRARRRPRRRRARLDGARPQPARPDRDAAAVSSGSSR